MSEKQMLAYKAAGLLFKLAEVTLLDLLAHWWLTSQHFPLPMRLIEVRSASRWHCIGILTYVKKPYALNSV